MSLNDPLYFRLGAPLKCDQATIFLPTVNAGNTRRLSTHRLTIPAFDSSEIFNTQLSIGSSFTNWRGNTEFSHVFQRFLKDLESIERARLHELEATKQGLAPRLPANLQQAIDSTQRSLQEIAAAKSYVNEASKSYDLVKSFSFALNKTLNSWLLKEQTPVVKEQVQSLRDLRKDLQQQLSLPETLTEASAKEFEANVHLFLPDLKQRFEVLTGTAFTGPIRKEIATIQQQVTPILLPKKPREEIAPRSETPLVWVSPVQETESLDDKRTDLQEAIAVAKMTFSQGFQGLVVRHTQVAKNFQNLQVQREQRWQELEGSVRRCTTLNAIKELFTKISDEKAIDTTLLNALNYAIAKAKSNPLYDNIALAKVLLSQQASQVAIQVLVVAESQENELFLLQLTEKRHSFQQSGFTEVSKIYDKAIDQFKEAHAHLNAEGPITLKNLDNYLRTWREVEIEFFPYMDVFEELEKSEQRLQTSLQGVQTAMTAWQKDDKRTAICNELEYQIRKAPTHSQKSTICSSKHVAAYDRQVTQLIDQINATLSK